MDPVERADVLFAQLDLLLAHGELEAASKLTRRLREHLAEHAIETVPDAEMRDDERGAVLGPLNRLVRQQRALLRDIQEAAGRAEAVTARRTKPIDPAALTASLTRSAEAIQAAFEQFAEGLEPLAAERILTESGRGVALLRKHVRSGRVGPVRAAADGLRGLCDDLGPEKLAESGVEQALQDFVGALDPHGLRAATEQLADRQGTLLGLVAPAGSVDSGAATDRLWSVLQEALKAMGEARDHLLRRDPGRATQPALTAARSLGAALRLVDDALGSREYASLSATGFLTPFVQGRQPEWELPAALGLRLHEALMKADLKPLDRKELTRVVRRLMDSTEADAQVRFERDTPERARSGEHAVDVRVSGDANDADARYLVRLEYKTGGSGGLRPTRATIEEVSQTFGGSGALLFSGVLEDSSVQILRLHNRGPGPRVGYVDEDDGLSIRDLVDLRLSQQFEVGEVIASPVDGEVKRWIDELDQAAEPPVSEEVLRELGIPWYDPADIIDHIRPVHEKLRWHVLLPRTDEDFPGLAWLNEGRQAWFHVDWGADGEQPRIAVPRPLVQFLAWASRRSDRTGGDPTFTQVMTAIQLHLGFKLAFYDSVEAERVRPWVHRAARGLERAYLLSQGLPATCVRDLFTGLAMRVSGQHEGRPADKPWEGWSRHAEHLFEARAGEELLRGGRLPASVVFGSLRGTLASALREQGQIAAARSVTDFAKIQDAAILFANLVIDPGSGEGVLISGDSKLGKSSITARLVTGMRNRGVEPWVFGCSDRVLVLVPKPGEGPEPGRVLASASPAHRRFGQWTEELWYRDQGKREVKPRDHVVSRSLVPIRSIVFIHRDGAEGRSDGLRADTIGDLVEDFQKRFGFGASRRFWLELLGSVSLVDVPLRRRGADTLHEAAEAIRAHMHDAEAERGLGRPRVMVRQTPDAWFAIGPARSRIRVTRIGGDGVDLDYFFSADGSAHALPAVMTRQMPLTPPRSYRLTGLSRLVPLESTRIEEMFGYPQYRVGKSRMIPLSSEYYRSTLSGPGFLVPDLPEVVISSLREMMSHRDQARWGGYATEGSGR